MFFFFKQKTAYEMRISDWSSDVCSSDLGSTGLQGAGQLRIEVAVLLIAQQKAAFVVEPDEAIGHALDRFDQQRTRACRLPLAVEEPALDGLTLRREIGRASCRESVCQYV